ncbi:MAG: ROK family transcriptional regulator [Kouleothrix sp.]|jgi:predicted NBD/HSP70 family sugar kinase|nr:ROK family transcriptional regulator [Kouleothrix sp.]
MSLRLRSGNRQLIREINQSLVLSLVRDHGPISRTEIAESAHLSLATVSGITSVLIDQGLIYEHEAGASTGGRRPILLALNPQAGLVIGVKLTETQIVAALTDMNAEVIEQRDTALGSDRRPEAVVQALADLVEQLRAAHHQRRIFGVGLGMAGVFDRRQGICRFSPFLQWHNVPLRHMLEQRLSLPVVIENDVNTLTMAEQWFGAGVGMTDFLVITLGRGIGMGMVLNGHLYRGGCGGGGEFGHITMAPDGPRCDCGKRGCLEALVSDPAILRRMSSAFGHTMTMDQAVALARQGDTTAHGIFAAAGRTLGMALADLVNIFNPPLLVIGGEGARTLDLLQEPLQETLRAHCFDGFFDDMRLVVEPWGDDAWARGAASLMLDELFRPDLYRDEKARASLMLPSDS